jgi:hypothetical protein
MFFLSFALNAFCELTVVNGIQAPSLPLPNIFIPPNLDPPLNHSRDSVHGWLFLPTVSSRSSPRLLEGYFYHHTPEMYRLSPHNFEIVVGGVLRLNSSVPNLPFPPKVDLLGTEYVLSPPAFSLDDLLNGSLTSISGVFSNGSFDTTQRYRLSYGVLDFSVMTAHYLSSSAPARWSELVYIAFVRSPSNKPGVNDDMHLYFVHLLEKSAEFDQTIHVVLNGRRRVFFGC